MNQNIIIGIVAVVILAILGLWYVSAYRPASTAVTETTTTDVAKTDTTNPATGSNTDVKTKGTNTFHSIFTQAGNHECTYEQVGASSKTSSVIYIADGKMRGEFRTTSSSGTVASLMVYSGGYLYSWKEGMAVGKKTTIKTLADLPSVIPSDLESGAIFGTNTDSVSWDCHDWNKDAKLLTIPTYITFSR